MLCVTYFRLKEFDNALGADVIDLRKLKELCFHGELTHCLMYFIILESLCTMDLICHEHLQRVNVRHS